ncbi:MAG TPA: phage major capsid protein [Chloroflexota bacterium]
MALLLAEAAKLSTDVLQRGVIETIVKESPILQMLPFITIEGNSYRYTQENTLGNADFYAVNSPWTESAATFTQQSAGLSILGGDADVDNFIQRTRSNVQDQRAVQVVKKSKAVAHKFEETFIAGDSVADVSSFNGVKNLITNADQIVSAGTNGAALTLAMIDDLIDRVKGSKPDALLMSRRSRRKLKSLLSASTHYVERGESSFGRQVMLYDGIPVEVSDWISDAETQGSSSSCSTIYALSFGAEEALSGLQNGGIEAVDVGQLETKDATRVRIRWYCGLALFNQLRCAKLVGVLGS